MPGELRVKGPGVFPGYLPASRVADPFDDDGYLKTGDLLEIAGVEYLPDLGIATFKRPERLESRDELPRNPLGKVLKGELRKEFRHSRAPRVFAAIIWPWCDCLACW